MPIWMKYLVSQLTPEQAGELFDIVQDRRDDLLDYISDTHPVIMEEDK